MSKKFRPNWNTVRNLLGSDDAVRSVAVLISEFASELAAGKGHAFRLWAFLDTGEFYTDNRCTMIAADKDNIVAVHYFPSKADWESDRHHLSIGFGFPAAWLCQGFPKYTLYQIQFVPLPDNDIPKNVVAPFHKGYFGITSRHPFTRFSEHAKKAAAGQGHMLHRAWNAFAREFEGQFCMLLTMHVREETLDQIYEWEEVNVAHHSLAPMGLNMIPGGRAGLRELHRFGALARAEGVSAEDRDAALEDLENGRSAAAAHYVKGHIRRLPTRCKTETTWVSPHWRCLSSESVA